MLETTHKNKSMRRIYFLLIFLSIYFYSCVHNDTCKKDYEGTFKLNLSDLKDTIIKNWIRQRHWDTVLLISKPDGKYYFNTTDQKLKECEGTWFTKSDNLEGDCIGYIKQNNLEHSSPVGPFIISILDSLRFSIQFVKIDPISRWPGPSCRR
jgi:hypothetical protein